MFFGRNEMRNDLRHGSHAVDLKAYAKDVEEQTKQFRDDLTPLEAGKMTIGERQSHIKPRTFRTRSVCR